MSLLEFKSTSFGRGNLPLIKNFSAGLSEGTCIALLGKNGAGKTTFFKSLMQSVELIDGDITYDGVDIFTMSAVERSRIFSFLLTNRNFDMFLKVEDLLKLGRFPYTSNWGSLTNKDEQIIEEFVELFKLQNYLKQDFQRLSDGEKQKCLLARTFIQDTPVLLLDEPGSYLDIKNKLELFIVIKDLAASRNKIVIFSGHDIESMSKIFKQFWFLDDQTKSIMTGDDAIFNKNEFQKAFSSELFVFDQKSKTFEFKL